MDSSDGIRTTDKLTEVVVEHLTRGVSTQTLCIKCLNDQYKQPKWLALTTETGNTPHTSCNRCGAITKQDYATRYS